MPPLNTAAYVSVLFTHTYQLQPSMPTQLHSHRGHWHIHTVKNTMMINMITYKMLTCAVTVVQQ